MAKPRIFYLAWTPPTTSGGACLAMHRHFVLHDDFELFVVSLNPFKHPSIPSFTIRRHPFLVRLSNTRLCRFFRQFEMVVEPYWFIQQIEPLLKQFSPDAIFTIPDNTISWTAYLLAQRTGLPLITNFQDWWPRGQFTLSLEKPYPPTRLILEHRFRKLYRYSSLAFCTSKGMKLKLGEHPNAPILYPCPAPRDKNFYPNFQPPQPEQPLRLIYAGTIISAYGRSVLSLAKALRGNKDFEFQVYGPPPDWSAEERSMMETSFTTKFLEYSQYGKPIIVWGPGYCQPVQVATTENAGLAVVSQKTEDVIEALYSVKNIEQWKTLAQGAFCAANGIFDPDYLHEILRGSIYGLLQERKVINKRHPTTILS